MLYIRRIVVLLLPVFFSCCNNRSGDAMHIALDRPWKFKTDDNVAFAKNYDDHDWRTAPLSRSWDSLEITPPYKGFLWYRTRIFLPSGLKNATGQDSLSIFLGQIGDCDQIFINGFIIGENNVNVPETQKTDSSFTDKATQARRKYSLSSGDHRIYWNKENLIAIRVFNNNGRAELNDNPYIGIISTSDSITFNSSEFYRANANDMLDTILTLKNATSRMLRGNMLIYCRKDGIAKEFYRTSLPVTVQPKSSENIPVSIPSTFNALKIYLTYEDRYQKIISRDSLNRPFVLSR